MAVTKALVLAIDEIMLGDLSMGIKHVIGAAEIVQVAGGAQALGLSGIVQYILDRCLRGHRLEDWDPTTDCDATFMKPETTWNMVH
ncbi:hypothetical protein CEP54_015154 [Fusarium duplospermum]|uniref:Uncharacterized protein n=1 Tax=Fusarium duplospermum TaxID=1325734 RepID=A0A428NR59_9HYPO|nr:hypothetical protein CEP54_015154 [Fusarium duplospermum]